MSENKIVDALLMFCDALDNATATLRNSLNEHSKETLQTKPENQIKEDCFNNLKWRSETGQKLGPYEISLIQDNNETDWQNAYDFLKKQNATISNRYHSKTYQFSYWIYEKTDYKIYRQKLKDASN